MRMAPEGLFQGLPACGVHDRPSGPPRSPRNSCRLRSTSIRGRGFAAYLSACGGQLLTVRCAHYAEGASLSTFGFVTIVPRYLPKASNSLTFVRGAGRACCAPRKWQFGLIYAPRKRPLGLLYCINGFADQPMLASASRRATPKGVERAPGSGTLPPDAADPEGCRARTRQRHLAARRRGPRRV